MRSSLEAHTPGIAADTRDRLDTRNAVEDRLEDMLEDRLEGTVADTVADTVVGSLDMLGSGTDTFFSDFAKSSAQQMFIFVLALVLLAFLLYRKRKMSPWDHGQNYELVRLNPAAKPQEPAQGGAKGEAQKQEGAAGNQEIEPQAQSEQAKRLLHLCDFLTELQRRGREGEEASQSQEEAKESSAERRGACSS